MKKENLNDYIPAYDEQFKFKFENELYLRKFASIIKNDLLENQIKNYLSLGIGHNIVSDTIINEGLKNNLIENYYVIDGSSTMIEKFRLKYDHCNLHIIETYFEDYEPSLKFDRIEMGFILEHVDDPIFILKKYKEYLLPNGKIHIAVPNARSLHRLIGHYAGLLKNVYEISEYDKMLGHKRYYDIDKIKEDIIKAGLKITDVRGLMLKPITWDQMVSLKFNENIFNALLVIGEKYPEIANCIYLCAEH